MRTKKAESKLTTDKNPAVKAPAAAKRPRKTGDVGKDQIGPVKRAAPPAQPERPHVAPSVPPVGKTWDSLVFDVPMGVQEARKMGVDIAQYAALMFDPALMGGNRIGPWLVPRAAMRKFKPLYEEVEW